MSAAVVDDQWVERQGDPSSIEECDELLTEVRARVEEAALTLNKIKNGVPFRKESGGWLSYQETQDLRRRWIVIYKDAIERQRYLKNWRRGRLMAERKQTFIGAAAKERASVTHAQALVALKRFGVLDELYDAVATYLSATNDDESWDQLCAAYDQAEAYTQEIFGVDDGQ